MYNVPQCTNNRPQNAQTTHTASDRPFKCFDFDTLVVDWGCKVCEIIMIIIFLFWWCMSHLCMSPCVVGKSNYTHRTGSKLRKILFLASTLVHDTSVQNLQIFHRRVVFVARFSRSQTCAHLSGITRDCSIEKRGRQRDCWHLYHHHHNHRHRHHRHHQTVAQNCPTKNSMIVPW